MNEPLPVTLITLPETFSVLFTYKFTDVHVIVELVRVNVEVFELAAPNVQHEIVLVFVSSTHESQYNTHEHVKLSASCNVPLALILNHPEQETEFVVSVFVPLVCIHQISHVYETVIQETKETFQ